jgi:hypothetical protein
VESTYTALNHAGITGDKSLTMSHMISVPLKTFAADQVKVLRAAGTFNTIESPPGMTPKMVKGGTPSL